MNQNLPEKIVVVVMGRFVGLQAPIASEGEQFQLSRGGSNLRTRADLNLYSPTQIDHFNWLPLWLLFSLLPSHSHTQHFPRVCLLFA